MLMLTSVKGFQLVPCLEHQYANNALAVALYWWTWSHWYHCSSVAPVLHHCSRDDQYVKVSSGKALTACLVPSKT